MTSFIVAGTPAPQGSKRHVGNGRMIESSPDVKGWRDLIRAEAQRVHTGDALAGAVDVGLRFWMPRPAYHYGTGRNAGRNAGRIKPQFVDVEHTVKPDLDKLVRAVLDAITEERRYGRITRRGVIRDDSQVVRLDPAKNYGDRFTGFEVVVTARQP